MTTGLPRGAVGDARGPDRSGTLVAMGAPVTPSSSAVPAVATVPSSRRARSARRARQGGQTIYVVLQRLLPLARRLLGGVKALTIASAASIVVIVAVVLGHGMPSLLTGGLLLVIAATLAPAPAVLWLFHGALRDVLALPEWLRSSPEMAKGHAAELAGLVSDARRSRPRRGGFVGDTVRAGRLLLQAHDDLPGYGAVLRLVRPPFLIAVLIAMVAAGVEIMLAAMMVVSDVVVRLLV
jgi:hypothetical protein